MTRNVVRIQGRNISFVILRKDAEALEIYKRLYNEQSNLSFLGIGSTVFDESDEQNIINYNWESKQKRFSIIKNDDSVMIGTCSVTLDDRNGNGEIDVIIDKPFRNLGYGETAINMLVSFCFSELRLHRIEISVLSMNEVAINCYKKCGFVECGVMHEKIFTNNIFCDVVNMEIINDGRLIHNPTSK